MEELAPTHKPPPPSKDVSRGNFSNPLPPVQHDDEGNEANLEEDISSQPIAVLDRRLSHARRALEAKKEARRERRSLKQNGDYLGVQGINPDTGQLDVLTPSESERSSISDDTLRRISTVRRTLRDAKSSYKDVASWTEREMKKILVSKEQDRLKRLEKERAKRKAISQGLQWRRHTKQWSSVHEPNLSPIAQSNASNNASRRTSHQMPLVDVASSPRKPKRAASELSDDSQDSTGTTIKTPHRLSLADPSPAALELFENGIRFNYTSTLSTPKDAVNNDQQNKDSGKYSDAPSPTSQAPHASSSVAEIKDQGHPFRETPGTVSVDYTDLRYPPKVRPWDIQNRLTIERSVQKPKQVIEWTSRFAHHPTPNHVGALDTSFGENRKIENKGAIHFPIFQSSDENMVNNRAPVALMPKTRRWTQIKAHSPPEPDNSLKRKVLQSMTNLRNRKAPTLQGRKDEPVPLANQPRLKNKSQIQKDMLRLRSDMKQLDRAKPQPSPDICATDHEWIEETIQSIAMKGMEVMAESASTPTITTTGSDHVPLPSNQAKDGSMPRINVVPKKRPSNQSLCNKPEKKIQTAFKEGKPEMPSNILVKETATQQFEVNAITSTSHLALTKERSDVVALRAKRNTTGRWPRNKMLQDPLAKSTHSTTPKTSSPASHHAMALVPNSTPLSKMSTTTPQEYRVQGDYWAAESHDDGDILETDNLSTRLEALHLSVQLPGSYPVHPAENDAIEPRSKENQSTCDVECDIMAPFRIAYVYAIPLFSMYWEVIGPVFDVRSAYWQRSVHNESTFMDGVTVLLALPTAITGMICLV